MHEHTTIPLPYQQLFTEDSLTEVVGQGAGSVLDVERLWCINSKSHLKTGQNMPVPAYRKRVDR
jgi:hypothetical protein